MEIKYTRKQYMDRECTHQEYYGQFCTNSIIRFVRCRIGEERIKASTDPWFNDIPLKLWDSMEQFIKLEVGRYIGEANSSTYVNGYRGVSLSDCVCVAKEAARIIKNSHN